MKKVKTIPFKKIFLIFVALGLFFVGMGSIFGIESLHFKSKGIKVSAIITDISDSTFDDSQKTYVKYEYNGVLYENIELNSYSSSWKIGDELTIYLMESNPLKPKTLLGYNISFIVICSMGVFYTLIGVVLISIFSKKEKNDNLLLQNGTKISAIVSEINVDKRFTINGKHPYNFLECICDNKTYKSNSFKNIDVNVGDEVAVYVGLKDKYYVDVESVTKKADIQTSNDNIIFTAFEPFGGRDTNASLEVAKKMGYKYYILPVSWDMVSNKIDQVLLENPKVVILCGEAAKYDNVTIEMLAHNISNGLDSYGVNRVDEAIYTDKEEVLKTNIDVSFEGIDAVIGFDAGKYLCNYVYYLMLSKTKNTKVIFIHYPLILEQGGAKDVNELVNITKEILSRIEIGD